MNGKTWIVGRMILTEEYHSAQTDLSLCDYIHHKSHTEWPGFETRSPGWEAGFSPPGTLHRQRVLYVLDSHDNKPAGTAKWQFRSKYRKEQCLCLSVAKSTAEERNDLQSAEHQFALLKLFMVFFFLIFTISLFILHVVYSHNFTILWRSLIIERLNWKNTLLETLRN